MQELFEQFPQSLRQLFNHCRKERSAPARKFDKDDFYLEVAEHMRIEPEDVRLVLHAVFASIHSQITEKLSEKMVSEMPPNVSGTWYAARKAADLPR